MEQIIEHDMELDNADTTVQILEKALTVFQIAKPFLVIFVLRIQTKKDFAPKGPSPPQTWK